MAPINTNTDVPETTAAPVATPHNGTGGTSPTTPNTPTTPTARTPSTLTPRLRSLSRTFGESDLPQGFLSATGSIASSVVTTPATRRRGSTVGKEAQSSWLPSRPVEVPSPQEADEQTHESSETPAAEQDSSAPGTAGSATSDHSAGNDRKEAILDERGNIGDGKEDDGLEKPAEKSSSTSAGAEDGPPRRTDTAPFDNGYHFPPSHGFATSFKLGAIAFGKFSITPLGVCVVIYGLLVVAFGGMLFLLLCNAAPAMCYPTCDDINSPRRKWIEYDSQILNALFCVTGFGLAPWRFRDLYFLMQYRLQRKELGLRRLAGIHRGWFRLKGSEGLPPDLGPKTIEAAFDTAGMDSHVPYPITSIPDAPLTGARAPPTKVWKMDLMVWANCFNTFMQALLSGFMWGLNRYDRPSWSTGLFVGLAIVFAALGGLVSFFEGKAVKGVEGVTLSEADLERLARDRERNIPHYVSLGLATTHAST